MKHLLAILCAAAAVLFGAVAPAFADNYAVVDATGAIINLGARKVGSTLFPYHVLYGYNGGTPTPYGIDALGNLPVTIQNASPLNFVCTSGCLVSSVGINAGSAIIGKVGIDTAANGVVLNSGTNIAGKFGIDQTTPGTTNGVQVNSSALPTGAATAANQTATQANAGSSATKADAIQGIANGVSVAVSPGAPATAWSYASTAAGTTGTVIKAAAGSGVKIYVTGVQIYLTSACGWGLKTSGAGSNLFDTSGYGAAQYSFTFATPLAVTANTDLVSTGTSCATTQTYNIQGFTQ